MDMEPAAAAPASAAPAGADSCTAVLAGQLAVGNTREPAASSPLVPFIQFTAYKATRLSDIVCKRAVRLYGDRVQTVHPQNGDLQGNEKTWYLDRTCRLEPEYVEEIVAEKRTVRPPGQWTVTAKLTSVTGQAQELIDLYCVTIHWPTSWLATKGYTSFTLGFETAEEAAQWHALVQRRLSVLRVRASSSKGDSSVGHSSKPSYDEGLGNRSVGSANGTVGRKTSQGFVAAALEHFWSSGVKDDKQVLTGLDGCDQARDRRAGNPGGLYSPLPAAQEPGHRGLMMHQQQSARFPAAAEVFADTQLPGLQQECGGSFTSGSTDVVDGVAQLLQQVHAAAGQYDEQRWVPYRHTNGVAIYHHKQSAASCSLWHCEQDVDGGPAGSEYMASSIVRGCPDECLSVLVDLSSNTTILGPASKIELLEDGEERQVLRLVVEATGMARRLCAPREVIVERLFKREECGVDVILFSSCEEPPVPHSAPASKRQRGAAAASAGSSLAGRTSTAGVDRSSLAGSRRKQQGPSLSCLSVVAAASVAALAAGTAGSWWSCFALLMVAAAALLLWNRLRASKGSFQSLWYKPVRAHVQGGYTISPREDCNAINSPECLVTCILKVDLRGFLGERSWLRPLLDALGWVDAYVERMLMAVILVKDEVEQQHFLVQPFSILTNNHAARASSSMVTATSAAGSSAADADEQAQEAAALRDGYSQHLRQQQLMRQRRRQLQLQQQQQAVYMQRSAAQAGFTPEEASRLAAQAYWGSGVATGLVRPTGGMYGAPAGLYGPDHGSQWPHRGPLASTAAADAGYGRQQQDALITAADGDAQSKRRQQGRLGRMASRIYALRPRLRKSDGTGERTLSAAGEGSGAGAAATVQQAGSAAVGMYKQLSASFKSGMAALTSSDTAAAADDAVTAGSGVAGADGTGVAGAAAAGAAASGASYDGGVEAPADLSNTHAVLKSLGLPPDTVVVGPQYYIGGPQGPAAKYSSLNPRYWSELHVPGTPAPFKLRGASYLADRTKVDGGMPQFVLGSADLVETAAPTQHISRFLPAVRCNDAAYSFVVNLIIPGTPVLSLVAVFINEHHPDILDGPSCSSSIGHTAASKSSLSIADQREQPSGLRRLGSSCTDLPLSGLSEEAASHGGAVSAPRASGNAAEARSPSRYETPVGGRPVDAASEGSSDAAGLGGGAPGEDEGPCYRRPHDVSDWQPFDFALHRFLHGGPQTRQAMFKLIPHIAEGSWVIKQSVGTVPVILGNKLQTVYYQTDRYIEATVDVTSSSAAAYITSMVRGATKSLVIDLGFVLEGQRPEELPEALLGAFRLNHLDCGQAQRIDTTQELPLLPRPLQQPQLAQMAAAAAAGASGAGAAHTGGGVKAAVGGSAAAEAAAAAAASGAALGACWQGNQQRLSCSASGAMAGALSGAYAADCAAQQPAQQQQTVEEFGQARGPSRARNSSSVLETGRTMTCHARSRSAASVEELYLTSSALLAEAAQPGREHTLQQQGTDTQPQPAKEASSSSSIGLPAASTSAPAATAGTADAASISGGMPTALNVKTVGAGAGSAGNVSSEPAAAAAGPSAASTAARQLFGGLLPFGSSGLVTSQQDRPVSSAKTGAGNHATTTLHACGVVTSLSGSSTPTAAAAAAAAASGNVLGSPPHAAVLANTAAAAGGAGLLINTGAGMGTSSHQHHQHHQHRGSFTSTPTAAAVAAAASGTPSSTAAMRVVQHQRTSSGTSDAASRTPGQPWPASPALAGSDHSASKLSAAAFISRAHAAALAASAQRRGQRTVSSAQSAGVYGSPGCSSFGSPAGFSSYGGEQLSGSPGLASSLAAAAASANYGHGSTADSDVLAASWQVKRPRGSSSGIPEPAPLLEQLSSLNAQQLQYAGDMGSATKISATEQLRLTHNALRASATGGGVAALQQGPPGSLSTNTSGMLGPSLRRSSAGGGVTGIADGPSAAAAQQQQPAVAVKKRASNHRRFASMGAVQ